GLKCTVAYQLAKLAGARGKRNKVSWSGQNIWEITSTTGFIFSRRFTQIFREQAGFSPTPHFFFSLSLSKAVATMECGIFVLFMTKSFSHPVFYRWQVQRGTTRHVFDTNITCRIHCLSFDPFPCCQNSLSFFLFLFLSACCIFAGLKERNFGFYLSNRLI